MKISTVILVVSLSIIPTLTNGVTIAQWTFEPEVQTPASVEPNTTASEFTLNSGAITYYSGNGPTAVNAIGGTSWTAAGPGASDAKWWEFTVTADSGYVLNLASLTFDDQASGTGAAHWSVTINGIQAISDQSTHNSFASGPMNIVDLSAVGFQDLTAADIKIFGFGASGIRGTWRLDNVTLDGMVAPVSSVPDSLPLSLVGAALFGVLAFARRLWLAAPDRMPN